jgi:hypothetical protein
MQLRATSTERGLKEKIRAKKNSATMRLREDIFWSMKELASAKRMNLTELCHESFLDILVKHNRTILSYMK